MIFGTNKLCQRRDRTAIEVSQHCDQQIDGMIEIGPINHPGVKMCVAGWNRKVDGRSAGRVLLIDEASDPYCATTEICNGILLSARASGKGR